MIPFCVLIDYRVTVEAYNMLEGRTVHKPLTEKENDPYQPWLKIDFKEREDSGNHKVQRYYPAYGFDFFGKKSWEKTYKGTVRPGTKERAFKRIKFLEANPKERTINIYDPEMTVGLVGGHLRDFSWKKYSADVLHFCW